jgi:hypothetical protein
MVYQLKHYLWQDGLAFEERNGGGTFLKFIKIFPVSSLAPALFEKYAPLCLLRERQGVRVWGVGPIQPIER